jgi:hypothetical protein
MVARGVRDPGAVFQHKLLCERGWGGRLHRRVAAHVGPGAGRRVRPAGRDRVRPARPGPGEEPAVGGGETGRLGDPAGAGAGAAGAAAPVGDRAVHRARAGAVGAGPGGRCARTCCTQRTITVRRGADRGSSPAAHRSWLGPRPESPDHGAEPAPPTARTMSGPSVPALCSSWRACRRRWSKPPHGRADHEGS